MQIRAGEADREMIAALGVDIRFLYTVVFALGAALAGFAGALVGAIQSVQVGMGEPVLILAFVVIVIGGIGSIRGALVGGPDGRLTDTLGRFLLPTLLSGSWNASAARCRLGACLDADLSPDGRGAGLQAKGAVSGPMRDAHHRTPSQHCAGADPARAADRAFRRRAFPRHARDPRHLWRWPASASTSRWGMAGWSPSAMRPSSVSAAMRWAFSPASHQTYEPLMTWPFLIDGTNQMLVLWLVAIIASGIAALVIGALSLRTSGVYFIMITLAFAQMIFYFAISWPAYGGEDGLSIYVRNAFPGLNTLAPLDFFLLSTRCFAWLLAVAVEDDRCRALRLALQAARQNEARVARLGIALPDQARGLRDLRHDHRPCRRALRRSQPLRQPDHAVLADLSGEIMVFVILGGVGGCSARWSAPACSCCSNTGSAGVSEYWQFFLGAALLAVVLFARGGFIGFAGRAQAWLSRSSLSGLTKRFGALTVSDGFARSAPRRDPRADRPQRGRQVDADQADLRRTRADAGTIRFAGREISGPTMVERARLGLPGLSRFPRDRAGILTCCRTSCSRCRREPQVHLRLLPSGLSDPP
jgi:branched-chain amino acid transport system permease protein